jgi:hypothetical protein
LARLKRHAASLCAGKEATLELAFRNARGTVRTDWSAYALLRDNVQHYLENGTPTKRFAELHGIDRAVDGHIAVLDAARLRGEVEVPAAASGDGTLVAVRAGWELPVSTSSERLMGEILRAFVAAVLAATETAVDGDKLLVSREPAASKTNGGRHAAIQPGGAQRPPQKRGAAASRVGMPSGAITGAHDD